MRSFDPTPLWRSTVGFDHLFNPIENSLRSSDDSYPPFNIERIGEDKYRISLAVAGFSAEDLEIKVEQNVLTIEARKSDKAERRYVYQGISARPFRRIFNLADFVDVVGAAFEDGLLKIDLVRELPEAMKPRRIEINAGNRNQELGYKKAA
jgi:molecular chaperone IbpA